MRQSIKRQRASKTSLATSELSSFQSARGTRFLKACPKLGAPYFYALSRVRTQEGVKIQSGGIDGKCPESFALTIGVAQEGFVILVGLWFSVVLHWRREGGARPKPEQWLSGLFARLDTLLIKFFEAVHFQITTKPPFGSRHIPQSGCNEHQRTVSTQSRFGETCSENA